MWRGKQHPHSRGRAIAALCCFNYCNSANVPGHGGESCWDWRKCGLWMFPAWQGWSWLLCCAEAWCWAGQTSSPAFSKPPYGFGWLFPPSSAGCSLPSPAHCHTSVFTGVSTLTESSLKEDALWCSPLLESCFSSGQEHTGGATGPCRSFLFLLASSRVCSLPSPCSGGGSPA